MQLRALFVAFLCLALSHTDHALAQGLAPLSDEAKALLAGIPDEHTPKPERHYFRSNEWFHDLLTKSLQGRGGAYVGVGSDQNYTMAALAGSELLLLIDFDPKIPWVHRIYGALVRASATPDELVAKLAPDQVEASMQIIRDGNAGDPDADAYAKHFKKLNKDWYRYVQRVRRLSVSWLGDPAMYAHIRTLFQQGRIVSHNGDLTATTTIRAIADVATKLKVPVRVVYFSNAEQFFPYNKAFRESMGLLPTDERSLVVRTVHHGRLKNAKPDDPTEWHYMVQDFADFKARMEAGYHHSFRFVHDLLTHRSETAFGDALSVLSSNVPIEARASASPRSAAPAPAP